MTKTTILLVEDNPDLNEINRRALEAEGYEVLTALNLAQAHEFLRANPEIILLEVTLPDGDGMAFCREIRQSTNAHIIFLTSRVESDDRIRGLDLGGDDYITKPYLLDELLARVRSALRRKTKTINIITKGRLHLNLISRRVTLDGTNMNLQDIEFSLLLIFMQNEDVPLDTEYLYEQVWGESMIFSENSIQKGVSRLRKKIKDSGYTVNSIYGKSQYIFKAE